MPAPCSLPIEDRLPELLDTLRRTTSAVLIAPPGAGKTTGVPPALLHEPWTGHGTILMLEPRRVAARAAAERMASVMGEAVGGTVGYRIRHDSAVSSKTRIEVVTEGVLTRRLQSDPGLEGVAAVIFDEFHERSIHADLGLALCLDVQGALRDDLRLLVMSATIDGAPVAKLLGDAAVIRSEGRAYPVETRWLDVPWRKPNGPRNAFETAAAELIRRALSEEVGDMLVFLPGAGEIERVQALLDSEAGHIDLRSIHGSLPFAKQRAALAPSKQGLRRVVLASAIAETSLTIEGVRIVVDCGLQRSALFDPGAGMTRLVTGRVSKASAEQRRGRAGRTEPGVCYRLWTKGEEGGLASRTQPEILQADLAALVLELAAWGVSDPETLHWLDSPPPGAVESARSLLQALKAIGPDGLPTEHGRALAKLPLHPRLAHLVVKGRALKQGRTAIQLAAILEDRDPLSGAGADLRLRLEALRDHRRFSQEHRSRIDEAALARIREAAKMLFRSGDADGDPASLGRLVSLAYPDRIAQRRAGTAPRYVMAGGKGAVFGDDSDPLADEDYLAIAHLDGNPREARIRLAARISKGEIEALQGAHIVTDRTCAWDVRSQAVIARRQSRLGAVILEDHQWKDVDAPRIAAAAADGVRALGLETLPWEGKPQRLRDRVTWLRAQTEPSLPDWSNETLLHSLDDWLTPHLGNIRTRTDFAALDLHGILLAGLSWEQRQALDRLAPSHYDTPAGTRTPIDYSGEQPALEIRIQEMFGETAHPSICDGRVPLLIRFLSPARRPVQVTRDLAGFWANSYSDVRKDLRGRYPRHPWPEDPTAAVATSRAKPRRH